MRELYYPGFEIRDINWLKYSLLYKEELNTIIPYEMEREILTPMYSYIRENSDLLGEYNPQYDEAEKTSREINECINKILRNPQNYFSFTGTTSYKTLMEKWNVRKDYELFSGKYSMGIEWYLLDIGLAKKSNNGIFVNKEIALIYMGALAENIARRAEFTLTTDQVEYKKINKLYSSLWDKENNITSYLGCETKIVEQIPRNLEYISIKEIIELRNSRGYRELIKAYNRTLNTFVNTLEDRNDFRYKSFVEEMSMFRSEFMGRIASVLGAVISCSTIIIGNEINNDVLKGIGVIGNISSSIGTMLDIKTDVKQYSFNDIRKTRKLVNKVRKLPFSVSNRARYNENIFL